MKIKTIDLPAYWAGTLINGDTVDNNDMELLAFIRDNHNMVITDCSDMSYIGRYNSIMCNMLTYSYTEG
jgi:hypothetical protein